MSIGSAYTERATQAVLGPARSPLIPAVLHLGWLDTDGDLIAMSGHSVPQSTFSPVAGVVSNVAAIDAGVAGTGWVIGAVGLFDAATGGELVVSADLPAPLEPAPGTSLSIPTGGLQFQVTA